jgi:hypothetical protein
MDHHTLTFTPGLKGSLGQSWAGKEKPVISATWEAENMKIMVLGKSYQIPTSTNNLGVVVHICNPSYSRRYR